MKRLKHYTDKEVSITYYKNNNSKSKIRIHREQYEAHQY